jgi:acetyl-CoA carboxylase biotin carboxyl carrier protein
MLKVHEIRELIKLINHSSIDEFTYEHEGSKIMMKKNTAEAVQVVQASPQSVAVAAAPTREVIQEVVQEKVSEPATTEQNETANLQQITSPMVGTFYASPSPDEDVYVSIGSRVTKGSVVCIVEAMKLFNEIEAEVDGEIVEILVENGQLVEFGQPLFSVKPV